MSRAKSLSRAQHAFLRLISVEEHCGEGQSRAHDATRKRSPAMATCALTARGCGGIFGIRRKQEALLIRGYFMRLLLTMLLLTSFVLSQQTTIKSDSKRAAYSCFVSATARFSMDQLDFNEFNVSSEVKTDDPDGCCIQWVPGQAKGCSQTKQRQCKDDARSS